MRRSDDRLSCLLDHNPVDYDLVFYVHHEKTSRLLNRRWYNHLSSGKQRLQLMGRPKKIRVHDVFGSWKGSVELSCRCCGRPINVQPKHLNKGQGRYCSRLCADRSKANAWKDRMWRLIDRSGGQNACWPWLGKFFDNGYPRHAVYGKMKRVNRLVVETCLGPIPTGWFACHECDNPVCCNPLHLFIGTQLANTQDMVNKNRVDKKVGAPRDDLGKFIATQQHQKETAYG